MQKLSTLELDMVSGGHRDIIIIEAPGHYVADHGHIVDLGRDIVTSHGDTTTDGWSDFCR